MLNKAKAVDLVGTDGKFRRFCDIEQEIIQYTVDNSKTMQVAAKRLSMGRSTLYRKLDSYKRTESRRR